MNQTDFKLSWRKEPADQRDYKFSRLARVDASMPAAVSLLEKLPEVYDQKNLGSCVANATASNALFSARVRKRELFASRLFVYWNARALIGETANDEGCYIRDAFKTIAKEGLPPESDWQYVENQVFTKPPDFVYQIGRKAVAETYLRLNGRNLAELKECLAQGHPFVFGFNVYQNFFSSWEGVGVMPLPKGAVIGGHAVTAIGYDDNLQMFQIKNSWGENWQDGGHFWMPYSFITSADCADFWTLRSINFTSPPVRDVFLKAGLKVAFPTAGDLACMPEGCLVSLANQCGFPAKVEDKKKDTAKAFFEFLQK